MKPVQFRIARGTFTLRFVPTLITLVMMAGLVGLGCWQIERLHWKKGLIAHIHDRMQEAPVDVGLSEIPPEDVANMDYHPGKAGGRFLNDKPFYLNATSVNDGSGGYDLLVPLQLDDGRVLLVNRGWMPYVLKDKPEGDTPEHSVYLPGNAVHLSGILRLPPDKKPYMRPDNDTGKNEWFWIDLPAMASAAGVKEFLPFVLEADDAPHDGAWPVGGQTRVDLPNNHFRYALTWFWLALILPVIYAVSNWKLDRPKKEEVKKPE